MSDCSEDPFEVWKNVMEQGPLDLLQVVVWVQDNLTGQGLALG